MNYFSLVISTDNLDILKNNFNVNSEKKNQV